MGPFRSAAKAASKSSNHKVHEGHEEGAKFFVSFVVESIAGCAGEAE